MRLVSVRFSYVTLRETRGGQLLARGSTTLCITRVSERSVDVDLGPLTVWLAANCFDDVHCEVL